MLRLSVCVQIKSHCKRAVTVPYAKKILKKLFSKTFFVVGKQVFGRTIAKQPFVYKVLSHFGCENTFQKYCLDKFGKLVLDD